MKVFVDGNQAIARAAIQAGCNFFAGYPITPATSILIQMMKELPKVGGIAVQAEDEIASMGFCIGAALTGKRAMTATSGPGISLYSESIGAAIMIEVPLVIVDVQRMGPATGAPTLGAYGDVQFVQWGNAGGYPIITLCPVDVADCYNLTLRAFDLAERFRVPVFLLTDKETALAKSTVDLEAFEDFSVRERNLSTAGAYVPYRMERPSEVPALAAYGGPQILRFTASSHDEYAYLTKNAAAIQNHNLHLSAKINDHLDEISLVRSDLQPGAETLVISYGIAARSAQEAVRSARQAGKLVSALTILSLWPVPEGKIRRALTGVRRIIFPELNLGLYKREIERLVCDSGVEIISLTRQDGSLIPPEEILEHL